MKAPQTETERLSPLFTPIEWIGFAALLLMGFAVPLFVIPHTFLEQWQFDTDRSEYLVMKYVLLEVLSAAALVAGALMILSPAWKRFRGPHSLAVAAIGGFVLWGMLSILLSPTAWNSFYLWLPIGLPAAAAITGVLFMSTERRCRTFLISMVICGVIISVIGVISSIGYRGINEFIFGVDPRDLTDIGQTTRTQGGGARAGALSTLANPEYAGSFVAVVSAIAAIMLFDWAPKSRWKWLLRLALFAALGFLLLQLVFSGSRQPWITLGLAGLLRLFIALKIPVRALATSFCLLILSTLFLGIFHATIIGLVMLFLAVGYSLWKGTALQAFRQSDPMNRWLVVAAPAVMLLLLVAFSTSGWWNPTGLRIYQRFASITSTNDQSVLERTMMYMAASQMAWDHPLVGVGPGRYTNQLYPAMYELVEGDDTGVIEQARIRFAGKIADQSHNDYFQIAAEMGIPALIFFLTALVALMAGLWRIATQQDHPEWRLTALGLLFCLITFSGAMMTSFPLQTGGRGGFFWATIAASLGLIAAYDRTVSREGGEGEK